MTTRKHSPWKSLFRSATRILPLVAATCLPHGLFALGGPDFVADSPADGAFPLCDNTPAAILVSTNDWPGVIRVAGDLAADIRRVTGKQPPLFHNPPPNSKDVVLIGTVGRSDLLDSLIRQGKLDPSEISGKWESFTLQVVSQPFPGIDHALVICGSDKRGTIYGAYELCEQIGVSPWYFWADVPPKHRDRLFLKIDRYVQGPPSVKYRGIFINDEAPALTQWVRATYGSVPGKRGVANYGRGFYTNVFELLLRLRANYLWPAMWNNAFNEDDPANPRLADEYGIVMGTSHQEPMLRAQQEWDRGPGRTEGRWDYNKTNQRPALHRFWREGIRRNKDFESIITIGLRAENDSGAPVGRALTEEIINVQRRIIAEEMNADPAQVRQMWCLYKEVMGYYNEGLRVPDDVTLLWAEDNWGNVRRLPTAGERQRAGGAGIYYHFDYHGGPRSYQWINTSPIAKVWDQMALAKQYGADRIWIVNVGHLNKSAEYPLEFFMRLAWDTDRWTNEHLDEFARLWATRDFGAEHAGEIADIITTCSLYNGRRKPELLDAKTYSLLNYREYELVTADYEALADRAQKVYDRLPAANRDAFYGMVQYPVKASAQLHALYLAAARNALYARQGRASANDFADATRTLFSVQTNLVNHFNRVFAGGKWDHFMDQPYIGYVSWSEPSQNNLNAVTLTTVQVPEPAAMGVAVEGSSGPDGGALAFDRFGRSSRYVEVFNKGRSAFTFTATPGAPWIRLSQSRGTVGKDQRIEVSVDWSKAPQGAAASRIDFAGANTNFSVSISALNPIEPAPGALRGFVEADGYVSIEAEHYSRITEKGSNRWIRIPHYGHTLSGMRADGPADTLATPGQDSPSLEYDLHLFSAGNVELEIIVGPTLGFLPGRPLRCAASFDDAPPRPIEIVPADLDAHNGNRDWEESVKNNRRSVKSTHTIGTPGSHTLKIWMIDPAVVLEKIVVNTGGVKPSYLGPPESMRK